MFSKYNQNIIIQLFKRKNVFWFTNYFKKMDVLNSYDQIYDFHHNIMDEWKYNLLYSDIYTKHIESCSLFFED